MSTTKIRADIKKAVDVLPAAELSSLADYVSFLTRPTITQRLASAEKAVATGKGAAWRKVRTDV